MARKTDIKTCRYKGCCHSDKKINIAEEEYVQDGKAYFHKGCFELKNAEEAAEAKLRADIQLIKNIWVENINQTVVLSYLYSELNKLIRDQGIDSEYVIFVIQYCIKNGYNLRYPAGLKFYVDKEEIKAAYKKENVGSQISRYEFKIDKDVIDDSPKFSIRNKPQGFSGILKSSGRR